MKSAAAGKRIAVLGFAFKANTGDTRESPAISVGLVILDPKISLGDVLA